MLVGALAEMVTIGAVIPFISLLADPDAAFDFPWLQAAFGVLGWKDPESIVTPMTLLFLTLIISASALRLVLLTASTRYIYALGTDMSISLYRRILRQPYHFHLSHSSSELITSVNKIQSVLGAAVKPALDATIALVLSFAILSVLLYIQPVATTGALFIMILSYSSLAWSVRQRLKYNSRQIAAAQTQRMRHMQEGLAGIRDVILDNGQDRSTLFFADADQNLRHSQAKNSILNQLPQHVVRAIGMILIVGFAWFLSGQPGGLTGALPTLGALALGAQRLLPLLQKLYSAWSRMTGSHQIFLDVLKYLDLPDTPRPENPEDKLTFNHEITLRDVAFRYPQSQDDVLRNVSLSIPKGSRIGISGPTGAGKSTLVDLIMGLLEPEDGQLLVDGIRVDATNRHLWGKCISHVPQDVHLLDSTIAENIALGDQHGRMDMEKVRSAAQLAQLINFVDSLPRAFRTQVGERGVQLSGGQRQRIALARAIYRNADLIILDEATSALDSDTEAAIMHALPSLDAGVTIIVIAHREHTLTHCDWVIDIKNGQVMNLGSQVHASVE